jgi:putative oxidoreductase
LAFEEQTEKSVQEPPGLLALSFARGRQLGKDNQTASEPCSENSATILFGKKLHGMSKCICKLHDDDELDRFDPNAVEGTTMNFAVYDVRRLFVGAGCTGPRAWAILPLRIILGYGFMAHGFAKLLRGPDNFARILDAIGFPLPLFMSWLVVFVEIFGGLAIMLGAFVILVSIPCVIILLVAIFTVHLQHGFSSIKLQAYHDGIAQFGQPGYETDLLYLAGFIVLMFVGSGPLALDNMFKRQTS